MSLKTKLGVKKEELDKLAITRSKKNYEDSVLRRSLLSGNMYWAYFHELHPKDQGLVLVTSPDMKYEEYEKLRDAAMNQIYDECATLLNRCRNTAIDEKIVKYDCTIWQREFYGFMWKAMIWFYQAMDVQRFSEAIKNPSDETKKIWDDMRERYTNVRGMYKRYRGMENSLKTARKDMKSLYLGPWMIFDEIPVIPMAAENKISIINLFTPPEQQEENGDVIWNGGTIVHFFMSFDNCKWDEKLAQKYIEIEGEAHIEQIALDTSTMKQKANKKN